VIKPAWRLSAALDVLETNMSKQAYRLTAIHQWVDSAIDRQLQQQELHDPLRLLRLRTVRLAIKRRLELLATSALALA
jgi:hypothetical protein